MKDDGSFRVHILYVLNLHINLHINNDEMELMTLALSTVTI